MDNVSCAKIMLSCLDLTSLHDNDSNSSIIDFCKLSDTPYGNPAALCIFPQFISVVKDHIQPNIKVATVINFPEGKNNIDILSKDIPSAIAMGADELDVVFPYKTFLSGDLESCSQYLKTARKLCSKKTLKVILETGEIKQIEKIRQASNLCIEAQADFIKTSTGKTKISATPEVANIILETIKASGKDVGFKASGGIKTFLEAKSYLVLAQSIMGSSWVNSSHFRIGASSLLNDLLQTIKQGY